MSFLYITENGAKIGLNGGSIIVSYTDGREDAIPKETVDAISIFGRSQLTAALTQYCLEKGIRVTYFSSNGHFYGVLNPAEHTDVFRLKKQIYLTDDSDFCLNFSKKIVQAKINNQIIVARRYIKDIGYDEQKYLTALLLAKKKVDTCNEISQLMGYEGNASREYFSILSQVIDDNFRFDVRTRRPAKDPFNAMLNFGYSMLTQEIHGELENRGINAYAGFLHKDKISHASLASDMIEEWRPVIVDSVVLSIIRGHEISTDSFYYEDGACLFTKDGIKTFIAKIERKMYAEMKYLSYVDKPITFRQAIWHQCERLARTIDAGNADYYEPIIIR